MSTTHTRPKNEPDFHDLGEPRTFTPEDIAKMDVPPEPPDDDHVTLVAIAAKSGVEADDGSYRDAALVLYFSPDGQFAIERVVSRAGARTPSKIPAAMYVATGHSKLGERSPAGFSGAAKRAVEAHAERMEGDA